MCYDQSPCLWALVLFFKCGILFFICFFANLFLGASDHKVVGAKVIFESFFIVFTYVFRRCWRMNTYAFLCLLIGYFIQ